MAQLGILNIGVAAHIAAASAGGPRFDPEMLPEERADISNGIWLCQNCAKLVDNDLTRFTSALLRTWRAGAEQRALDAIGRTATRTETGTVSAIYRKLGKGRVKIEVLSSDDLKAKIAILQYFAGLLDDDPLFPTSRLSIALPSARVNYYVSDLMNEGLIREVEGLDGEEITISQNGLRFLHENDLW